MSPGIRRRSSWSAGVETHSAHSRAGGNPDLPEFFALGPGIRGTSGSGEDSISSDHSLARAMRDQGIEEVAALFQLGDCDELVSLVRLVDIAGAAHHRRDAGHLEQAP